MKGLYQKAISGEIPNFTGVSDPYEAPESPEVVLETARESVEASTAKVLRALEVLGFLAEDTLELAPEDEEAVWRQLEAAGRLKGRARPTPEERTA